MSVSQACNNLYNDCDTLYQNAISTTTSTSGTVTLSKDANDYYVLQIWIYRPGHNTFFIINTTVSNMNSNFRIYYDNEWYFNYVGSASYSKSFAWTSLESINLYRIDGIKKRK